MHEAPRQVDAGASIPKAGSLCQDISVSLVAAMCSNKTGHALREVIRAYSPETGQALQ